MEQDFDFMKVGKSMPYRTPDGFFERMKEETMRRVEAEKRRKKLYRLKVGFAAVLSAAAIWCGVLFFNHSIHTTVDSPADMAEWMAETECDDPFCVYLHQLSDEELEEWIAFAENDIFMYEKEE